MAEVVLPTLPPLGGVYARAALNQLGRRGDGLPDRTLRVRGVETDLARLAAYDRLCGYRLRDYLPASWVHVLTFPLQAQLMGAKDFPFPMAGIVHAENTMTLHRPVAASESLDLSVRADNLRGHRKGALFDLVGEARVGDELVWSGVSAYMALGATVPGAEEQTWPEAQPEGDRDATTELPMAQRWRLPADLGRRYAQVSGDINPIHLHPATSRLFGFKRPIIHGMWTHARALSALEGRLPDAYTASVRFTKPITLPATAEFAARTEGATTHFEVRRKGVPALVGQVSA